MSATPPPLFNHDSLSHCIPSTLGDGESLVDDRQVDVLVQLVRSGGDDIYKMLTNLSIYGVSPHYEAVIEAGISRLKEQGDPYLAAWFVDMLTISIGFSPEA